jgi:hypothetical protein
MVSVEKATEVVKATRRWLEKAVLGLDLCPFAKAVYADDLIRYAVSSADAPDALLADLVDELQALAHADPAEVETTLLIHPGVFDDFLEYNDFLGVAEEAVADLGLEGILQVASFHPRYQFAGTEPDAIENYTNRSPYPLLHILREESIERAVEAYPDATQIYEKNIATLRLLGHDGWRKLGIGPEPEK